ncbi:MAG: hypothetical protein QM762_24155 [Chryseolinea sp.]
MDVLESIIGKFHPLIVHLPIGILLLAFVFELLVWLRGVTQLRFAVDVSLLIGALSAIVSCVTGYFLGSEGGYPGKLLTQHQYLGIATAALTVLLFLARRISLVKRSDRRYLGVVLFAPVIILLALTGHAGGSLTHGEEFLSFTGGDLMDETSPVKTIANIDEAILFREVIQPILQARCYSCHSSRKQKGDLRLDSFEFVMRGGKHGEIIVDGLPDSSLLYTSLMLALEDDRHMPPKEKPQLSSTEIAILQKWIEEGPDTSKKVKDLSDSKKMKSYVTALQTRPTEHWVPQAEVSAADASAVSMLKSRGVIVLPVAQESNYISINFINKPQVSDDDLELLGKLADQLIWLSLEGTSVTDAHLQKVSALKNLRVLALNNTMVTGEGLKAIAKLPAIQILNVVNTPITDEALQSLATAETMTKIFVYRTKASKSGIQAYHKLKPNVVIDTGGYVLPKLTSDTTVYRRKV